LTLFLAIVLLWSGFSTVEAPRASAQPAHEQKLAIAHADGKAAGHGGSVEHHHLDDLPSQAHSDTPAEPPGLLPATLTPSVPLVKMAQPRAFASAAAELPFIAGPLRPPRNAALAG